MDYVTYRFRHGHGGFTLMELLISIAVSVIFVTVAIPAMRDLYQSNARVTSVNRLVGALHFARTEAINRTRKITLCPSNDGSRCDDSLEWQNGWMVFANSDGDTASRADDEPVIRVQTAIDGGIRLVNGSSRRYLVYQPSGTATGYSSKFLACDPDGNLEPVGIWLSNTGRIARVDSFEADDAAACLPPEG